MRYLLMAGLIVVTASPSVWADQMIKVTPSRSKLYLGKPFTIDITISPPESYADIQVDVSGPPGFKIDRPIKAIPSSLVAGGSSTVIYTITPPSTAYATTETYNMIFNVSYRRADAIPNGPMMTQSVAVPFTITFSRTLFNFWGMVGIFVGWLIKALGTPDTPVESDSDTPCQQEARGIQRVLAIFSRRGFARAFTSLAMGFLTLLILSRHELPTGAVHDTLALGIGLGFLSDDKLLTRINSL